MGTIDIDNWNKVIKEAYEREYGSEEEIVKALTNAIPHDTLVNTNWTLYKDTKAKDLEIERLNNIINKKEQFLGDNIKRLEREVVKRDNIITELEKWLWEQRYEHQGEYMYTGERKVEDVFTMFLDKLKELRGDKE